MLPDPRCVPMTLPNVASEISYPPDSSSVGTFFSLTGSISMNDNDPILAYYVVSLIISIKRLVAFFSLNFSVASITHLGH